MSYRAETTRMRRLVLAPTAKSFAIINRQSPRTARWPGTVSMPLTRHTGLVTPYVTNYHLPQQAVAEEVMFGIDRLADKGGSRRFLYGYLHTLGTSVTARLRGWAWRL